MPEVDVEAVLISMQAKQGQELNWRTSIVDLMKLLGLDSSLVGAQGTGGGIALQRQHRGFGRDEHVAAQGGDAETRAKTAARCRTI